jgi:nucleotide-binding universal stress UspA family protein
MNLSVHKPIVVPVDLSPASDRVLEYVVNNATDASEIVAAYVGTPYVGPEAPLFLLCDEREQQSVLVQSVREHFSGDKFRSVRIEVRCGEPGAEIAALAKEIGAGLIVMASHGRRGVNRLFSGSVAEMVMRRARCPVLILRGFRALITPAAASGSTAPAPPQR